MAFEIQGKVALISGGASGIGLQSAKEFLRNGLKGVTLADINDDLGKKALEEIENEFGINRAIFVHTDVTNMQSYEEAFKKTIEKFTNLDIVVNSAGICNDSIWQKEIAVNVNGVVHGVLLALENYIPKYRTSSEGVIVNLSSIAGVTPHTMVPIYSATKFAIMALSKSFGDEVHYNRTKVRVLALCPGLTETPLVADFSGLTLGPPYQTILDSIKKQLVPQKADNVAFAMMKTVRSAKTGTVWVVEDGKDPYEYVLPPRESFAPK